MENEKELSGGESLALIAKTINDAKNDDSGIPVSVSCFGAASSLFAPYLRPWALFLNYYLQWHWLY